jgi:NarL family two-component system response regulator LiaR
VTSTIAVLLADDHPVVRQGLKTFLELQPDVEVAGEACDGAEAVALAAELGPDVVLLDLVMPGLAGAEAIRRLRASSPGTKVIVLTSFAGDDELFPALRAGADAYLLKDVEPRELVEAIRRVHAGEALLNPKVAARVLRELADDAEPQPDPLTPRELDVVRLLARGLSNKAIAAELVVSEKTVKTHVSSILGKLGLTDRTQAALYAVREHLVELD